MIKKRFSKNRLGKFVFGCLFAIIGIFSMATLPATNVYAEEPESSVASCENNLGEVSWSACPQTDKITQAVDWLYDKIKDILVIDPVEMKDGTPIYEVWKYARMVTNIVFIILLLVVIYSQITGVGISNYGIKKILPKLIIVAVLVNLSFIICSLAVDLSNIIGGSLRGLMMSIEQSAITSMQVSEEDYYLTMSKMYSALGTGYLWALAGGKIMLEAGAIYMLIPVALGALVAVVSGLITIAMRQAVVMLLVMIAPLAIVAYMLPNTEKWFKKWKDLFVRMLVFYPMFSLLFGVSSLAGGAIIASSKDTFGLILGLGVKIFPLFFSWSLMKMSGTFLATVNAKINSLAATPLAASRAWASSQREHTRQRYLASKNVYTPSLRLRQYLSDRKIAREEETKEYAEVVKNRGLAYAAMRNYKKDGTPSREGEESYEMQARNMQYQRTVLRHKNNMNKGLGQLEAVKLHAGAAQKARLDALDIANMNEADYLKMETARGAKIDYDNTRGFYNRVTNAITARMDLDAINAGNNRHQLHNVLGDSSNMARYETMKQIMEGKDIDTSFIAADAAHAFNAQAQIVRGKFKDYFDYTAPTQDVVNLMNQLTKNKDSNSYIDPIIAGLRTLNMRGDTDLVTDQIKNVLADRKVALGTYASQSLSNFLMFDVKGNDPFLRRFGKYINLETAKMFNEDAPSERRTRKDVSLDEYVNGEYVDYDENGRVIHEDDGSLKVRKAKRGAAVLLKGTSFKDMERTAMQNMVQTIRDCSVKIDEDGNRTFDYEKFKKNDTEIWDAIMPNVISDQFSFLSGSEQIVAFSKALTGVDVKDHKFDFKAIFGDYAESLTPEQKQDYIKHAFARTKTFLGGHVPGQIARTKTDVLEAITAQYALRNAILDDDGEIRNPEDVLGSDVLGGMSEEDKLNALLDLNFKNNPTGYKEFENDHIGWVSDTFYNSFKPDAILGFAKMHNKGYQGEAKDGLVQLLKVERLERLLQEEKARLQRLQNNQQPMQNNQQPSGAYDDEDEDDDGMPVVAEPVDAGAGSRIDDVARNDIRKLYDESYRGGGKESVGDFWNRAKSIIESSGEIQGKNEFIEGVEVGLSQYDDVGSLYAYIINKLFGGFNS